MTFNGWTFLFEIINFVVLAYVLHRLLYEPLRTAIDQRREATLTAQTQANAARNEAEGLAARLRQQLTSADDQRQALLQQARQQAETERQQIVAEAEQSMRRRQDDARQMLDEQRKQALSAVEDEVIAQAVDLAKRLLYESCDRSLHQQLADRLVETLGTISDVQRGQIRSTWQPIDRAVLESADGLDAKTLQKLNAAVTDVVGQPVALTVLDQSGLIGGVRLKLGGYIWDASLAGQLSHAAAASEKVPPR
ncbi:MAG TPA: F0F1 ATP synthase subunit B [Pirellulales bacterium]|nr:F0F1 ATP synthase subunit B [Pirellulales bacterium]